MIPIWELRDTMLRDEGLDPMGGKMKYEKPRLRIQKANIVACM